LHLTQTGHKARPLQRCRPRARCWPKAKTQSQGEPQSLADCCVYASYLPTLSH